MRALTRSLLSLGLALMALCAWPPAGARAQAIPGLPDANNAAAEAALGLGVHDMKLGSVLFYNVYTSDSGNTSQVDTMINITNVDPARPIAVHLFFIDSLTCNIADAFICLTPNQTATFFASEIDPDVTGYIVAVAVDSSGRPVSFNRLAGDALVGTSTGHRFGLAAVAAARRDGDFASPFNADGFTATMFFNNAQYDALPGALVLDSFPSQSAGFGLSSANTQLYVYSPLPDLSVPDGFIGSLFFLVRDDQENTYSASLPLFCYLSSDKRRITSLRTSPNINTIVPPGHTGWAAFYGLGSRRVVRSPAGDTTTLTQVPLMGAVATKIGVFTGGHNLRYATVFNAPGYSITIPIIPPGCPTVDLPIRGSNL